VEALATVADLIEHLGGIPLDRVRLHPALGTAVEQDVVAVHDREKRLCELVDGVLVEKAVGYFESVVAGILLQLLNNYLDRHDLGIAAGPDGMMRLTAGLVRIPDVSFVSWERLPDRQVPREPIAGVAPDLAVEVLSAGNTPREMERKLREYFEAGVRAVWMIDPRSRSAEVYSSPAGSVLVEEDGVIDGGNILPGFTLSLRDLFKRASREKR
jgi:Uma2 family endonuclease